LKAKKDVQKKKLEKITKTVSSSTTFDDLPTLHAIVVFNDQTHKEQVINDYEKSCCGSRKLRFMNKY